MSAQYTHIHTHTHTHRGQDGWVRKEEGRGRKGGGLARKDAALMVKQGKKLGFDSKEMSKWQQSGNGATEA